MITPFPAGGLFNRSTMNAKLEEIGGGITAARGWQLIQVLDNTGPMSGTWTAPDFFGDGLAYDLGIYAIGGGGSGHVNAVLLTAGTTVLGFGGCSGFGRNFIIQDVAPGTQYNYVIGSGGQKAHIAPKKANASAYGNSGGTTSFNGNESEGGYGGAPYNSNSVPHYGSQIPDMVNYWDGSSGYQGDLKEVLFTNRILYAGAFPFVSSGPTPIDTANIYPYSVESPKISQNMFDNTMITLSAGALAQCGYAETIVQTLADLPDGTHGGGGYAFTGEDPSTDIINPNDATGYGNGGGGTAIHFENWSSSPTNIYGSAGSDGAIFLYARRSQEVTA